MVVSRECCAGELLEHVTDDVPHFQQHTHVQRIKKLQSEDERKQARVVQIDFAMMACQCEHKDEIQSAMWSWQSIALLTVAVVCYLIQHQELGQTVSVGIPSRSLTMNCLRKLYTTQLTSDLAAMTNFCLINLHILMIVN